MKGHEVGKDMTNRYCSQAYGSMQAPMLLRGARPLAFMDSSVRCSRGQIIEAGACRTASGGPSFGIRPPFRFHDGADPVAQIGKDADVEFSQPASEREDAGEGLS